MRLESDPALETRCRRELLRQLERTLSTVVARAAGLDEAARRALAGELLFAVAAHLDGSAYGGEVDGEEIYPRLGFLHGDASDALLVGGGAALHELVPSVLREIPD